MLDMMPEHILVACVGVFGGILLGLAARLGRFCTLGAIEDVLYGGSDLRLRMWGIAIGVAMTGSFGLMASGFLQGADTFYLSIRWLPWASVIGGLMFGYGMALAGNCGFGAIARLGGGDLRSFVIVLVMGVSTYVVLNGPIAPLREMVFPQSTVVPGETPPGIAHLLGSWIQVSPHLIGIGIGLAVLAVSLSSRALLDSPSSIVWASVVGLAVISGWAGTAWVAANGFEALPVVSHSFAAPLGESILWWMIGSAQPISFAVGSVAGVWFGAFIGSLIKGHFRWEACEDPRELRRQIFGAALMGAGAVIALGCTVGQGISAFSVLSFSAPVTFLSIFLGAAFGLRQLIVGFRPAE
ncbi:YeeE/YedE family protein [Marivita sp. S6314]|uniref:YeeE/YedE family protein n=1 Tax=Marivita sp. S6314 TaxID=2926406 RepID=UPI001FF59A1A|nr:YeeE/YedE family protein [Marivita sp. S6314]MCK0151994.1 YeeE/YedE family protein [Marivita sp. S6314]